MSADIIFVFYTVGPLLLLVLCVHTHTPPVPHQVKLSGHQDHVLHAHIYTHRHTHPGFSPGEALRAPGLCVSLSLSLSLSHTHTHTHTHTHRAPGPCVPLGTSTRELPTY